MVGLPGFRNKIGLIPNMRILYLNHYAGSPKHGMEYRPYYLSREWLKSGDKVNILAASYSHLRQNNPKDLPGLFGEEEIDGIIYSWYATPKYSGNGIGRVLNIFVYLFQVWNMSRFFVNKWTPDVVIASSTYPLDIYPARFIAKHAKARLIFEVHDLWPLTPVEVGGMSPRHPWIWLLQKAENFAYRVSDAVVSMLPCAKEHMVEHGMAPEKFHYVPNGIVVSEWESATQSLPEVHLAKIEQLKAQGHFLVGYAGGHGLANALQELLKAADWLRDEPVSFVLVGDGPDKLALEQMARELGLGNVHFLPPVAKAAVPALLAHMDALFIGWRKLPIYRFGINPNKLFDYMMSARPVIHSVEAGNDIVREAQAGLSVAAEDPAAIAAAVRQLMAMDPAERQRLGENGKRYVLDNHDYSVLAKRFQKLFKRSKAS
ncbi:O-antigen biosynthesis protein WlbE [Paludibacterium sp. THUN1379]|nr:O-antigen biosynthesis protein WlbE [Paludibacterium sp. THUN1379]